MNSSGSGSEFLSGYTGGCLGMNRSNQQTLGGFLGLNTGRQTESSDPSRAHGYSSSINMITRPPTVRPILSEDLMLGTGKDRTVGPGTVVDDCVNNITSDDDDDLSDRNGENGSGGKGRKGCNWQRMKWTDDVVRQLIRVVACVGDDGSLEDLEGLKRKSCHLHKKGKWKTVSKIMISKGCYVSPQQCEDKFNDLNKRYKKLNDILGRGTSCKVVENPILMDSMPHLSTKAKETVKKLLCSKHLFYREMCAYHNGQNCHDLEVQVCSSPVAAQCRKNDIASSVAPEFPKDNNCAPMAAQCSKDINGSQEVEAEDSDETNNLESETEDDDNSSQDEYEIGNSQERYKDNKPEENDRLRSDRQEHLQAEIDRLLKDPSKSHWERREWIKKCMLQLQEERIRIQSEAVELEKQQIKWQRFCSKKEMELETAWLEEKKLMLENEHRALQLKQKEVDLEFQKPEASVSSLLSA